MMLRIKSPRFWLAIIFGTAISLTCYQEIWIRLWNLESLRLKMASYASLILFIIACFYFLEIIIHPRFASFTKSQKTGVILLTIFTPIILAVAVLDQRFLEKNIYFLLPEHTIQIEAPAESPENLALTAVYTQAQGSISFNTLEMKGWERKGNEVVLTNPNNNQIMWKGKTGGKITLTLDLRNSASGINVRWDSIPQNYNISSISEKNNRISKQFDVPLYANWIPLAIATYLSAVFAIFSLSVVLISLPGVYSPYSSKWAWLVYAFPMYVVWLFYLLVFWPGFMSRDSIVIWDQVVTEEFIHDVPVGYTLTVWLITRFWFSPTAVGLVQIIVLGGVLGWGITTIREFGAPNWLTGLVCIALAISPANSVLSITLWKDILFSTMVVALTIQFLKITATNGQWLNQKMAWLWVGIILALVSFYGRNGFFVSSLSVIFSILVHKAYWKPLLKSAVLFLGLYFLLTGPVYQILDVKKQNVNTLRALNIVRQLLSTHMHAGTFFSAEDEKILKPISPQYPWSYNCYRNSALAKEADQHYVAQNQTAIIAIALRATRRNPLVTLQHFGCRGASVYRIPQEYQNEMMILGIQKNEYGFKPDSKLHMFYQEMFQLIRDIIYGKYRGFVWLIWRMPFWMYLSAFACSIFCIRHKMWRPILVLAPGLLTVLPYLILTGGQIFRYLYSMYLIGILLSGYLLVAGIHYREDENHKTYCLVQ